MQQKRKYYCMIMEDFNAKIGKEEVPHKILRKFVLVKRNERGKKLIEFAYKNNLKMVLFSKNEMNEDEHGNPQIN